MFYKTKIQSINGGSIIDAQGRRLAFIGYLPVKVGDTVFTDGKYIFGNVPPKGSTVVFDEPSGIPVLGDSDSSDNELRGYLTTQKGIFKRYMIKGDQWIVNNEKKYAHDEENSETVNEDEKITVIDAEIALDENGQEDGVYTVEKIVTQPKKYDENYDNDYIWFIPEYMLRGSKLIKCGINLDLLKKTPLRLYEDLDDMLPKFFLTIKFNDCDYARLNDDYRKQTTLAIKKDNVLIVNIELSQLIKRIEDIAFLNVTCVNISDFERLESIKDYIKSRACLLNFKITPNGTWEALLDVEIIVERGFSHVHDSFYEGLLELESETKHNVIQYSPRIDEYITRRSLNVTPPRIVSETCYDSTTAIWRGMVKITSESGEPEIIFSTIGAFPLYLTNAIANVTEGSRSDFEQYTTTGYFPKIEKFAEMAFQASSGSAWVVALPFDGGYYSYEYEQRDWYGIPIKIEKKFTSFNTIAFFTTRYYNSKNLEGTPDYNNCELEPDYNNYKLEVKDNFTFTVQDDYQAKIVFSYYDKTSNEIFWKLGGILDKDNNQVIGEILPDETDAHKWNMSLTPLKNEDYVFGIHKDEDRELSGKLYKVDKQGNLKEVGDGLKNFRLRELKKISKARK